MVKTPCHSSEEKLVFLIPPLSTSNNFLARGWTPNRLQYLIPRTQTSPQDWLKSVSFAYSVLTVSRTYSPLVLFFCTNHLLGTANCKYPLLLVHFILWGKNKQDSVNQQWTGDGLRHVFRTVMFTSHIVSSLLSLVSRSWYLQKDKLSTNWNLNYMNIFLVFPLPGGVNL